MFLILFVSSLVLSDFLLLHGPSDVFFLTLILIFPFSCRVYNEVWLLTLCMGSPFPMAFRVGPLFYFPRSLPPLYLANPAVLHYRR